MAIPGSTLVFTTGTEQINFTLPVTVDKLRLSTVSIDYLNKVANVRIQKGFDHPSTGDPTFVAAPQAYPIRNLSAPLTASINGQSFTSPSGTHYDDFEALVSADGTSEHLEDAAFAGLESMGYFSGTETD